MIKRLRFKFVIINMSIVTVLLGVILGLIYYFTSANLENSSINTLRSVAMNPPRPAPGEALDVNIPFFMVQLGPNGEVLETYGGYFDLTDEDALHSLVHEAMDSPGGIGVISGYNLRYYRADFTGRNVIVFADISSERATLSGLSRTCVLIGVLGFLAFLGISAALSRWAVRPVERAWDEQREFVAAASHELKTPLTVIMTNAELSPPCRQSESILTASRRMKALIEQLLTLARAENVGEASKSDQVDLSSAVQGAVLEFEPLCFESGKRLSCDLEPDICVCGDEGSLSGLVRIFLDNAVKYSSEGGRIDVRLRSTGRKKCRLTVSDEGEPIPPEEQELLFRRFYRAPGAKGQPGFGLGLSIAENTARRAGGRIWCESRGGVNSFCVELPKKATESVL